MKYFPKLLCLPLLLIVSIAAAEEETPEITLDPSGYRSSQPEFVEAPDFVPDLVPRPVPDAAEQRPQYPLNRIVAIVNNDVILSSELEDAMDQIVKQLNETRAPLPEHEALVKQVLERLVFDSLNCRSPVTTALRSMTAC